MIKYIQIEIANSHKIDSNINAQLRAIDNADSHDKINLNDTLSLLNGIKSGHPHLGKSTFPKLDEINKYLIANSAPYYELNDNELSYVKYAYEFIVRKLSGK